jgi:hypothetical protein
MIETKLHDLSQKFEAFSKAVDERIDVVDTAQQFSSEVWI